MAKSTKFVAAGGKISSRGPHQVEPKAKINGEVKGKKENESKSNHEVKKKSKKGGHEEVSLGTSETNGSSLQPMMQMEAEASRDAARAASEGSAKGGERAGNSSKVKNKYKQQNESEKANKIKKELEEQEQRALLASKAHAGRTKLSQESMKSKKTAESSFPLNEVIALGGDAKDHEWLMDVDDDDDYEDEMVLDGDLLQQQQPPISKGKEKVSKKKLPNSNVSSDTADISTSEIQDFIKSLGLAKVVSKMNENEEDEDNEDDDDDDADDTDDTDDVAAAHKAAKENDEKKDVFDIPSTPSSKQQSTEMDKEEEAVFNQAIESALMPEFSHVDPQKALAQIVRIKRDKDGLLLPRQDGRWFEADYAVNYNAGLSAGTKAQHVLFEEGAPSSSSTSSLSQAPTIISPIVRQHYSAAELLLKEESEAFDKWRAKQSRKSQSDDHWLSTVMSSGTLSDKLAALVVKIQESATHRLQAMEMLISMARKKGKRESVMAIDTLLDLFTSDLLPDRKLIGFTEQPHTSKGITDRHLVLWYFEDCLKRYYAEYVGLIVHNIRDPLVEIRTKMVRHVYNLLRNKPELERPLLAVLINKLGDSDNKLASKVAFYLSELLSEHPNMKLVVVREVEQMVFRPKISQRAQYYAVCFINQIILTQHNVDVAAKLISIYFTLFKLFITKGKAQRDEKFGHKDGFKDRNRKMMKKKRKQKTLLGAGEGAELDSRMLSAILTGVNRAYPFALPAFSAVESEKNQTDAHPTSALKQNLTLSSASKASIELDQQMDTLFQIVHICNFNTAVQALMLLFQVTRHRQSVQLLDRFYRVLYEKLMDPHLISSSKHAMFLNLLFRSLKVDENMERVKAFVKRILQISAFHQPQFVCGALILISELAKLKPAIITMIVSSSKNFPIKSNEKEDSEQNSDIPELSGKKTKQAPHVMVNTYFGSYDPLKRDPQYAHASDSCLWELTAFSQHYHPSVCAFAKSLLSAKPIEYKGDALQDFTLMRFLDRFSYKNPKNKPHEHGSSIMQPHPSSHAREKQAPVNSKVFLAKQERDVPDDERFFWHFFKRNDALEQELERKVAKKKQSESDDFGGGFADLDDEDEGEGDEGDIEEQETKLALHLAQEDDEEEEDEEVDDDDDDDDEDNDGFSYKYKDMPADDGDDEDDEDDTSGHVEDDSDDYEDDDEDVTEADLEKMLMDDFKDEDDINDQGDDSNSDDDNESEDDEDDFAPEKKRVKMGKSWKASLGSSATSGSVFADAEEFAHLLEDSGTVNTKERRWQEKKAGFGRSSHQAKRTSSQSKGKSQTKRR